MEENKKNRNIQGVDFHHKVAYRFERAYKIIKIHPEKKNQLNLDIVEAISESSDYIQHDPSSLFFCLYFCIFYNNPDLIEFLRTLIKKMAIDLENIQRLLEFIDVNGIERLRTVGEAMNSQIYHTVLYHAFDEQLRVIYS